MFKEGNKYWTYREWLGRKNKFTPEELFNKAVEYFQWCEANPIEEEQLFNTKLGIDEATKKFPRPFTIEGLCNHIGICVKTFDNYGKYQSEDEEKKNFNSSAKDYLQVVTHVRQVIYDQKFSGAAVNLFNSNIIARDLNLVNRESHSIVVEQPLFPDTYPDEKVNEEGDAIS